MSEINDATVAITPTEDPQNETSDDGTEDLASQVEKWKALSRKNEARAKENADKARQFDEIQESNKSEQEKLQDQLVKAQEALAVKEAEIARVHAAQKHGLSEAEVEILSLVPAEKVEEVAAQLAGRASATGGGLRDVMQGGTDVPPKDSEPNTNVNDLIRAARN